MGEAYLLFADRDMIDFIKEVNKQGLQLGYNIGLISYDDTPMKEILEGGITVISTDFKQMGHTAGRLIIQKSKARIANPSRLIIRKSL
jgi:DNA-binding LacI/PurR family transcriptional regulator